MRIQDTNMNFRQWVNVNKLTFFASFIPCFVCAVSFYWGLSVKSKLELHCRICFPSSVRVTENWTLWNKQRSILSDHPYYAKGLFIQVGKPLIPSYFLPIFSFHLPILRPLKMAGLIICFHNYKTKVYFIYLFSVRYSVTILSSKSAFTEQCLFKDMQKNSCLILFFLCSEINKCVFCASPPHFHVFDLLPGS